MGVPDWIIDHPWYRACRGCPEKSAVAPLAQGTVEQLAAGDVVSADGKDGIKLADDTTGVQKPDGTVTIVINRGSGDEEYTGNVFRSPK